MKIRALVILIIILLLSYFIVDFILTSKYTNCSRKLISNMQISDEFIGYIFEQKCGQLYGMDSVILKIQKNNIIFSEWRKCEAIEIDDSSATMLSRIKFEKDRFLIKIPSGLKFYSSKSCFDNQINVTEY